MCEKKSNCLPSNSIAHVARSGLVSCRSEFLTRWMDDESNDDDEGIVIYWRCTLEATNNRRRRRRLGEENLPRQPGVPDQAGSFNKRP